MSLFRRKEDVKAFRNYRFSGGRTTIFKLLLVELMYIVPCALITFGFGMIMSISTTLITIIYAVAVLSWLINLCILSSRVLR